MAAIITSISPDRPSEAIKTILAVIVQHAGGDFVGVQDASPEHSLPAYVLFNHPVHLSTLALRLDENFGTDAIRRRLAECDERYGERGPRL
jgi:hypothetical protein